MGFALSFIEGSDLVSAGCLVNDTPHIHSKSNSVLIFITCPFENQKFNSNPKLNAKTKLFV